MMRNEGNNHGMAQQRTLPRPHRGGALRHIAREEARREMNEGKLFERDFKASVPVEVPGTDEPL